MKKIIILLILISSILTAESTEKILNRKIKQLMELKSIGLLGTQHWRDLGFYTYENDIKSEIKVSELLETYNNIKSQYLEYLTTDNSKKVFERIGFNSLFLAKLLKKLNLQIVNGRILDKYNTIFIQNLFEYGENINEYKKNLLSQKDSLIKNLSDNQIESLKNFFKMSTTLKLLNAIKTNGVDKTIPEFKTWLQNQSNGILSVFYQDFSDEYIEKIDMVLESVPEELVLYTNIVGEKKVKLLKIFEERIAPIKQKISNDYSILFYNLTKEFKEYTNTYRLYNELEIIEIITHEENSNLEPENEYLRKAQAIIELKEIGVTTFTNLVLNTPNLLYPNNSTNLYYLYNIYRENDVSSIEGELENLISDTIIILEGKDSHFYISNPNFEDLEKYSNLAYSLSETLIYNHHFKYEALGTLIKNITIALKNGIDIKDCKGDIIFDEVFLRDSIWDDLGIDINSSLSINADKNLNLPEIIENYTKLSDETKKSFGLETDIFNIDYYDSSLFFDPITSMLLAKTLLDKGYYIDKDEYGNDDFFNIYGKNQLSLDIEQIIKDFRIQYENDIRDFDNLFNNGSLGEYLGDINTENNPDLDKMLGFIKLAYTKNLRTGEKNISFDFGMSNIGGDIIWGNITSSMSSRMGLGLTSKENMDNVFNYLEEKGRTPEILVGLGNAMIKDRLNSWGWGAWNHYDDKAKNAFIDNLMNAEKMKNQITPIEVDELFSEVFHNKVESEKNRLNSPFKNDTLGAMNVVLTNFENALNAQKGIRDLASLNSINTGKARVKAEKEALRLRDLRMDATKALIDARFAFELSSGLLNDSPDKEKRK